MNNPIRYMEEHCILFWLWLDIKDKYLRKSMRLKKNKHRKW